MKTVKVNVIFHSVFGHTYTLAEEEAKGAREVEGVEVGLFRVQELLPPEFIEQMHATETMKRFEHLPEATLESLSEADGLIFGTPTRYGMMSAQMREFIDTTGSLWLKGALAGKPAAVFTSSNSQHGGQEATILSFHTTLLHQGMVITGVPNPQEELGIMTEISGGTPYGASTIVGSDGSRMPSENELKIARHQGKYLAEIAKKLFG